jgi:hypothetical protein
MFLVWPPGSAELVTTLRGHYRGIVSAVMLYENGSSAPDVEIVDHRAISHVDRR